MHWKPGDLIWYPHPIASAICLFLKEVEGGDTTTEYSWIVLHPQLGILEKPDYQFDMYDTKSLNITTSRM
tara:strand:- start:752 stop:961 length:210 start_codon:yes stop_codon:yes gene_type:complete